MKTVSELSARPQLRHERTVETPLFKPVFS